MNYAKVQTNLEKLEQQLAKLEEDFKADGFIDAEEQKILKDLRVEIAALEPQITARIAGKSNPKDTTGARFDKVTAELAGAPDESRVQEIVAQEKGIEVASLPNAAKGFMRGLSNFGNSLVDAAVTRAADLVYSALHAAANKTNCVIAITASSTISPGAISFSGEDGIYMTPDGKLGLLTGIGVTMAADDIAEAYSSGGSSLLKSLLTDGGISAGVNLTFIFNGNLGNLGGTAWAAGVGAQIGPTNFDGNVLFASAADLAQLRNPTGFILAAGVSLIPGLDVDLNFTRAEAWLD